MHSQKGVFKEKSTVPKAEVQQPMIHSQWGIYCKSANWEELAPLPVKKSGHSAVLLGDNIYVGGGYEGESVEYKQPSYRIDVYNLTTKQWNSSPITTPYRWFAMTVMDDKLVTSGGATKYGEVVRKILVLCGDKEWEPYSEMPTARHSATAFRYCSMLIVVGGCAKIKGEWTVVSTTEILDTTNGCWYTCNDLPTPHQQMKAAIMEDRVYLLGGANSECKMSPKMFVASLNTLSTHQLKWQSAQDTPNFISAPVVLYEKYLLVVGGGEDDSKCVADVRVFNPSTAQWEILTYIPEERGAISVVRVANDMIVMGGMTSDHDHKYSHTVWICALNVGSG